ncbi:uncharacterized protein LOC144616172 isoform X3 [Panthera onca]
MAQCVNLLVFLHGVLAFQTKGVLGLSEESSDSSRGYKKSYYIFQMLPIQNLKGRPENAFDRKAADPPALWPSSVLGARDVIRPAVSTVGTHVCLCCCLGAESNVREKCSRSGGPGNHPCDVSWEPGSFTGFTSITNSSRSEIPQEGSFTVPEKVILSRAV